MYKCYFYFIICLDLECAWYQARRPGPEVALAKARTNFLKLEEAQNFCILIMKVKPAESSNLTKKHDKLPYKARSSKMQALPIN